MASSTPPPRSAPAGELLAGRYRLERRIGQGGMAEVWVATDTDLDRRVAVKWLKTNLAGDPVVAERFRREAVAVARLNHPNIVGVHDVVTHEGRQAVVMQLVDGKSLRQLLDSQKRLGPELTIHIGAAIAGALDAAHQGGFVHRDVKPGNILVTSDGRVLLTDFGIAKGLQAGDEDLTSDNVMMGTAKYLSPEQVRGRRLDGRADLYSLSLVLYECLAGRVPFLGETDADTALARLQRDPTDLGHLRPTLPIGLVNLIHKTLARNPAHRPQSGTDLRAALLSVDTSPPHIDGTPAEPPARIANPPKRALGAGPGVPGDPHMTAGPERSPQQPLPDRTPPDRRPRRDGAPESSGVSRPHPDADAPRRDHRGDPTPPGPIPIGTPARRDDQRWGPSLIVVSALLIVSLIVAAVLFVGVNRGDAPDDLTPVTVVPGEQLPGQTSNASDSPDDVGTPADDTGTPGDAATAGVEPPVVESPEVAAGPATIVGVEAWDPDGTNGSENDGQAALALADGSAATAWSTECYSDRYLGGKRGVGLIVNLSGPGVGTLRVDALNGPYQLEVYSTADAGPPGEFDAWKRVGGTRFADEPGTVTTVIDTASTHLLVWLKELGPDDACSSANPYRGRLGEISFAP
jgi:serine/threonine-protein kinase